MSEAVWTIITVVVALGIGSFTALNPGIVCFIGSFLLAIAFNIPIDTIMNEFPISIFLTLLGTTYMFSAANLNGTLKYISDVIMRLVGGRRALVPFGMFFSALIVSSLAGTGAAAAICAVPVLALAAQAKINPFLASTMSIHGACAGTFTPFSSYYAIILGYERLGYPNVLGLTFVSCLIVNSILAVGCYVLFGGLQLIKEDKERSVSGIAFDVPEKVPPTSLQKVNLLLIVAFAVLVMGFKYEVGYVGLAFGCILSLLAKQEKKIMAGVPWGTIMMVVGAQTLVGLLIASGATKMISDGLLAMSSPLLAPLLLTAGPALGSAYTTAVAAVAALAPIAEPLMTSLGNPNLKGLLAAMATSSTITTQSPLSISGAVYTGAYQGEDREAFFRKHLFYGLSHIVIGSTLCWFLLVFLLNFS